MVRNKRDFDFLLSAWILTGVVFSLIGFYELWTYGLEAAARLGHEYERLTRDVRTTALFEQPNSLGFFLVLCIILGVIKYLVTTSRRWRLFLWVAVPFMFLVLLSTFSRKSFLGMFLAGAYLSLQRKKVFWGFLGILLVTFLIVTILGYAGFAQVLIERFATFFQAPEEAIGERVKVWTSAFDVFLASPVIGSGLGSTVFYLRLEDLSLQTTHNMYLYILAELGLIGFLLFLLVGIQVFGIFHLLAKTTKDRSVNFMCKGLVAGFIVILAQGGFKALNLVDPILWGHLGLATAFFKVYKPSSKVL
jgi:O-antigen ligase